MNYLLTHTCSLQVNEDLQSLFATAHNIPEYAIDKHTSKGKKKGLGLHHFYTVGSLVENEPFSDPWVDDAREWYGVLEQSKDKTLPKPKSTVIHAFLLAKWNTIHPEAEAEEKQRKMKRLLNGEESKKKKAKKSTKAKEEEIPTAAEEIIFEDDDDEVKRLKTKFNDMVKQQQKQKPSSTPSKKRGRRAADDDDDATVSDSDEAKIKHDDDSDEEGEKKAKKKKTYAAPISVIDESSVVSAIEKFESNPFDMLSDSIFTQMPCGKKPAAKVGNYTHATNVDDSWNGERVFIKGPVLKIHALTQYWCNIIKNAWSELRPLDTRMCEYKGHYYILMKSLDNGWTTTTKTWRGEEITTIVNGSDINHSKMFQDYLKIHSNWTTIDSTVVQQYLAILLYRQVLGITDTCNRNVLERANGLYSIDETHTGRSLLEGFIAHVSKPLKAQLKAWFTEHQEFCFDALARWKTWCENRKDLFNRPLDKRFEEVEAMVKSMISN